MVAMVGQIFTVFIFGMASSLPLALIIASISQVRRNIANDLSV